MAVWGAPKPPCFGELFVVLLPRRVVVVAVSFWGVFLVGQTTHSSCVDRRQQVHNEQKKRRSTSMRIKYNELLG